MNVTVRVDASRVLRALADLSEATSSKVIYRSLNKAVDAGKTEAIRYTRVKLNLKRSAAAEAISVHKASSAALTGQILIVPKGVPLLEYSASQNKKGVSVQVYKGGARKTVRHAFIATMTKGGKGGGGAGHRGVFTRYEEGQAGRSGRLPIRALFSLSVRDLFKTAIAVQHVTKVAAEVFMKESKRLIDVALKKSRAA